MSGKSRFALETSRDVPRIITATTMDGSDLSSIAITALGSFASRPVRKIVYGSEQIRATSCKDL